MSSNKKNSSVDPVIVVALGVILMAIAFALLVFKPSAQSLNFTAGSGAWSQLVVAFVTGITTGGLSCLAVQGGLLASSLAHQIEQDYIEQTAQKKKAKQIRKLFGLFCLKDLSTMVLESRRQIKMNLNIGFMSLIC